MTEVRTRPSGAGNLPLASSVGVLVGIVAFALAYLIGPRNDSLPTMPFAVFVGAALAGVWTWRMYRNGWSLFHFDN